MAPPASTTLPSAPTAAPLSDNNLTDLPAKQLWHNQAPSAVRDAWKKDDRSAAWIAWQKHLKGRSVPTAESLAWGLRAEEGTALAKWAKKKSADDLVESWVAQAKERETSVQFALEAVGWARRLPALAQALSESAWWSLTDTLTGLAQEANRGDAPDSSDASGVVIEQLLAGELALTLGKLLPELKPLHELATTSKESLSEGIERLTDGEGLLRVTLWVDAETQAASVLLACWTRCRALVGDGKPPWSADAQLQFEWLVRQTLRMTDRRGRVAFTASDTVGAGDLIREALRLGGDPSDHAAAGHRLKGYKADDSFETPAPSGHSEWAELSVLALGWSDKGPRIVVAHPADTMRVEIHVGKQAILAGEWPIEASIAGKAVRSTDDWDVQCWYSDDECDYLELALPLQGDARLERQFFLAREDGVGFVAETLFSGSGEAQDLEITTRLPLGTSVGLRPEKETREAILSVEGKPAAGLIPLALPEWRDDPNGGELTAEAKQLVLTRQFTGRNAASPLWIDFAPRRFDKQRTWRQLAVAESLKNVAPDTAISYRVQAAKQQWIWYRSLDKPANRTFMGLNYSSEQVVGQFTAPEGTLDEYFEIEGEE